MAEERNRGRANALRVAGMSFAVASLVWTFRASEPEHVAALLARVGGAGVLIVVPQLTALFVESFGWRLAFAQMGQRLPLFGLFRARLATEALAQTLPLGVVFCESMKPALLSRTCGADLATSLSGMAARKWLLVSSQSLYVGSFALLGLPMLRRVSVPLLGNGGMPGALFGAAALLALMGITSYALLAHGQLAVRAHATLLRLPWGWLRSRLAPLEARFARTDGQLQTFFASAWRSPGPLVAFTCSWLLETADTFLILYLLGVRLPWTSVGALEVAASFLRNVAFMLPAGLGIQDLSYLAFLRALSVPDALNVAVAFLLLKRSKEAFCAACGYIVLALELRGSPPAKALQQAC